MKTNRTHATERFHAGQEARLLDMFDGALPPEPPEPTAPAAHDFLVMCLRPDDPPPRAIFLNFRSAA